MAAPAAVTLDMLVREGLTKAGYPIPTAIQKEKAKGNSIYSGWIEEIKNDIWTAAKNLKSLQTTNIQITTNGISKYSNPIDYSNDMTVVLLDGSHYGTVGQDFIVDENGNYLVDETGMFVVGDTPLGTALTITLASTETITESSLIGKEILIYAGTAKGAISQCVSYNSTTKVATVSPAFNTVPVNGDSYMIIDTYKDLIQVPVWDIDRITNQTITTTPTHYAMIGDSDDGEFILYPTPYRDTTVPWGIKMRYYANLMKLDMDGVLMSTFYRNWRNIFTQGIFAKALQETNDNRAITEMQVYKNLIATLIMREQYGMDISNIRMQVTDY